MVIIPSMDQQSTDPSTNLGNSSSRTHAPFPPPPSLRRHHAKRPSAEDEDDSDAEVAGKGSKKWLKQLTERPPTERVLRPRTQQMKRKSEAKRKKKKEKEKKKTTVELRVSLTRKEIADDFLALTGCKPPRWPKQRRKTSVQIRLNRLFPGLCLPRTITSDTYGVKEMD